MLAIAGGPLPPQFLQSNALMKGRQRLVDDVDLLLKLNFRHCDGLPTILRKSKIFGDFKKYFMNQLPAEYN